MDAGAFTVNSSSPENPAGTSGNSNGIRLNPGRRESILIGTVVQFVATSPASVGGGATLIVMFDATLLVKYSPNGTPSTSSFPVLPKSTRSVFGVPTRIT